MVELLFLLSFLVELQSNCIHIYLENKIVKYGVNFISLLFKKPVSWLSFIAPPLNPLKEVQDQDLGQQESLGDIEISTTSDEIVTDKDEDDGTIPDEESYIELSLPSGHYVGQHFSKKTGHQDFGLIQLLAEYEDDNLIEIDISVGSVKCYTFQIKA
ncbi:uncharacterized protein LOC108825353 [Raphanus sativus]|uniref:Uncharacterized protein LOC108825353 n=1 Tax=Raphanus sativus TaxID=3726 RepID=A0A9W3CER2_RAPSA|nr:uncharacterized protein LOC108825353 [Raphanus sativus]